MNKYIFREYDIRGKVDSDLNDNVIENIGKAFGTIIIDRGFKRIAVSGDIRESSINIKNIFMKGLLSTGVNVIDLGIITTPMNYFSMYCLEVEGSVQITGSHNPPEYNGLKFSLNRESFFGDDIRLIYQIIQSKKYHYGIGEIVEENIFTKYKDMISSKIKISRPIRVAMDCGNASAGLIAPELFKKMGIELEEIFCDVNPNFPNHHPDPTVDENLKFLIECIKKNNFDFGVAFDGDADRLIIIDELGNIIRSDILMTTFLPSVITHNHNTVIFDVKCSKALIDMIEKNNGTPLMWKTGHSLIKSKMNELNIKFGGEMSGHIFFADDFYGFDDAIYVALRFAQLVSETKQTVSQLISEVPKYYNSPEIRLDCSSDSEKFKIIKRAINYYQNQFKSNLVDGIKIYFDKGWALIRASNTQPAIVCRFESETQATLNNYKNNILNKLKEFGDISISD